MSADLDLSQAFFRVAEIKHRRDGTLILTQQIEGLSLGSCPHLHCEAVSSQAFVRGCKKSPSSAHLLEAVGGVALMLVPLRTRALRAFGGPNWP